MTDTESTSEYDRRVAETVAAEPERVLREAARREAHVASGPKRCDRHGLVVLPGSPGCLLCFEDPPGQDAPEDLHPRASLSGPARCARHGLVVTDGRCPSCAADPHWTATVEDPEPVTDLHLPDGSCCDGPDRVSLFDDDDDDPEPELVRPTHTRTALISDTEAVDMLLQAWNRAPARGWNGGDAVSLIGRLLKVTGRLPA